MLSSARRELARTEQLVEMMKDISPEIRALREDLRRDVDEIRDLLARMRELAAAHRETSSPGRTDSE